MFIDDNTKNCKAVMDKGVPTIQMECAFTTQSKGLKRVTDWNEVYEDARKLNVNSLFFAFTKDMGNKSDFVGRIYAMLNAWNDDNKFELHFALQKIMLLLVKSLILSISILVQMFPVINFII